MNTRNYLAYKQCIIPALLIKQAASEPKKPKSRTYSEDEFNRLVKEYEDSKLDSGSIVAPYEDILAHNKLDYQDDIDYADRSVIKNRNRARGWKTYMSGLGGAAGFGLANYLSNALGLTHGEEITDPTTNAAVLDEFGNPRYKPRSWGRALGSWALHGIGTGLGAIVPHLFFRGGEYAWDGISGSGRSRKKRG